MVAFCLIAASLPTAARGQDVCADHADVVPAVPAPNQSDPASCELLQFLLRPGESNPLEATHREVDPSGLAAAEDSYRWVSMIPGAYAEPPAGGAGHDFRSACWRSMLENPFGEGLPLLRYEHLWGTSHGFTLPRAFRLGTSLMASPSVGDFLPPAPTIGASSIPLLPPGSAVLPTGWQGSTRPTLDSTIDLITGLPLLRATDIELPFGGATFRLTRTRSGTPRWNAIAEPRHGGNDGESQAAAQDRWWDWAGVGWMVGENPILLIDSALPDLVGPHPRVTWLVLDAHHAIPFQQVNLAAGTQGPRIAYEAPPRFRARMTHNGDWGIVEDVLGNEVYGWETPPTQFEVWLYDGLVKYTFFVVRDDVPNKRFDATTTYPVPDPPPDPEWEEASYHDIATYFEDPDHYLYSSDRNPGFGIPHYGLCAKIEDGHGHIVEMAYCTGMRTDLDDPGTDCLECQQQCVRKGMLSHIKLKTRAGEAETVHWTLLYSHRFFAPNLFDVFAGYLPWITPSPDVSALLGSAAIDRIYIYEGEAIDEDPEDGPLAHPCLTVPADDMPYSATPIEPLESYNSVTSEDLPTNWLHQIRYHYEPETWINGVAGAPKSPPVLMWTETTHRRQDPQGGGEEAGPSTTESTFYRNEQPLPLGTEPPELPWIERIYPAGEFERLRAWGAAHGESSNPAEAALAAWLSGMEPLEFAVSGFAGTGGESAITDPDALEILKGFASIRLDPSPSLFWPEEGDANYPAAAALASTEAAYFAGVELGSGASNLAYDSGTEVVGRATVRGHGSTPRHYRVHRFLVTHEPWENNCGGVFHTLGLIACDPQSSAFAPPTRSMFFHPYRWNTVEPTTGAGVEQCTEAADLSKTRWIAMIDEFGSWDELIDDADYRDDEHGTKAGQLSRRIVQMNAAGYILTDTLWEFDADGGVTTSGGGLGERFVYSKLSDLPGLEDVESQLMDLVVGTDPNDPQDPASKEAQLEPFLNQLLLLEHRSVGWSAAELDESGDEEGSIKFYEYGWFPPVEEDGNAPPWQARVQLIAEGIKKGVEGSIGESALYTRQLIRDAATPSDVIAEVDFLTVGAGSELIDTDPPPAPDHEPSDYRISRWDTVREPPDPGEEVPTTERRITRRQRTGPPRQLRPGSEHYFPVEVQFMAENGTTEWSAVGLVRDWETLEGVPGDELESLVFSYTKVTDGFLESSVADAVPGAITKDLGGDTTEIVVPAFPDGLARLPDETDALQYSTYYEHDHRGPKDIWLPNGRRWSRRTVLLESPPATYDPNQFKAEPPASGPGGTWTALPTGSHAIARDFVFNDLEYGSGAWKARSPGEVLDYNGPDPQGPPGRKRRVEFTMLEEGVEVDADVEAFLDDATQEGQVFFRPIVDQQLRPDQYGRVTAAELFELNVDGVMAPVGLKQVNDLGEVFRERDMDGTITRTTRDALGKPLRRYIGTIDDDWTINFGGQFPLGSGNNLVLVERTEYGLTPNDAWLPTVVRRYDSIPADDWYEHAFGPPPSADPDGQATITSYDWRMRPVRTDTLARGDPSTAPRLTTTLTYLDHAGRARLTATYGGGTLTLGTGLDPAGFAPDEPVPDAADIMGSGLTRPLTLTEMIYGPGGEMTERRDYDVAWNGTGDPPYHAEFQFTGQGGNIVFRQAPGAGAEVSTVDGLGRVASSATVVPRLDGSDVLYDFEIARTDHVYDADSNLQQIKRWERIVDADSTSPADPELNPDNAVLTRTFNWHDVNKRLIATAELGAMDNDGTPSAYLSAGGGDPSTPAWFDPQDRPSINIDGQEVVRLDIPATVPLTVYHFDRRGHQSHIASPSGAVTAFTYTGTGKVAEKLENAFSLAGDPPRSTRYEYRFGRLAEVLADRLDSATPEVQRTYLTFGANEENNWGAQVVDIGPDGALCDIVSAHGGHVADMILIDESADPLEADPFFTFRYDFLGRIAERIDARGVVLRYRYDALDRLSTVEVGRYDGEGAFEPEYPAAMNESVPADRIGYVTYTYAHDMNTFEVRAYASKAQSQSSPPGNLPIAATKMEFDARGRLVKDWQALGRGIVSSTPRTSYEWDTEHTGTPAGNPGWPIGHARLDAMTYPTPPGGASTDARIVEFGYGAAGTPDDLQSRIAAITTSQPDTLDIAAFAHIGSGRRARMELAGGALVQDFGLDDELGANDAIGLHGIDALGRIADLHWRQGPWDAPEDTLARVEYTHDVEGNRLSALRTPRPLGGLVSGTSEHQDNSYDALNRLITCDVEHDDGSTTTEILADSWDLDLLGNWVERTTGPPADPLIVSHEVNDRNEITQITLEPDGGSPEEFDVRYDAAGNLAFDGTFAYRYDAWNRLLAVNLAELDGGEIILAEPVKHFTYDGLGRLARVQSPWPTPLDQQDGEVRTERFFYDGIRRIQEVVSDPVQDNESAAMGGESAALAAYELEPALDGSAITAASENNQVEEGGGGSAAMGGGQIITYLEREYVWGPGDRGVDELLVQFDREREPWWAVQDAGLDIVALCDTGGTPSSEFPSGTARVVAQFGYDAHGSVVTAETLFAHALVRSGHKGLFFDRLDLGVADPLSLEETPRLAVGADLLGYARNRAYSARLGRWVQRDPNGMGAVVLSGTHRPTGFRPGPDGIDLAAHFLDGTSLFEYVGSRSWRMSDPLGLYIDPVDLAFLSYDIAKSTSSLITSYAFDLEMDADWASDWSAGDWEQSRFSSLVLEVEADPEAEGKEMAILVFTVKQGVRGARRAGGLADNVARLWGDIKEMHHLIARFAGGAKRSKGSVYELPKQLHGQFHREWGEVTQRVLGSHPNSGRKHIMEILDTVDFRKIQQYRSEVYGLMRRFDAEHGTYMVSAFRREFRRQRSIVGHTGFFR